MTLLLSRQDLKFLFHDWPDTEFLPTRPRFAVVDRERVGRNPLPAYYRTGGGHGLGCTAADQRAGGECRGCDVAEETGSVEGHVLIPSGGRVPGQRCCGGLT